MKKVIVLAACLFAVSSFINAQESPKKPGAEKAEANKEVKQKLTVEQRAQKSVDELNTEVTLTEEQKTKVLALATTRTTNIDAIRTKYKGQKENKEVAKTEIENVRKEYRKNVKAILTPEQIEKLKAKHKEKKAAGKPNALDQD
jgi:Spy/CpxP family protein refolding chaperone